MARCCLYGNRSNRPAAAGSNNGGPGRILYTIDGGNTWINKNHTAPSPSGWNCIAQVGNSIWFAGAYGTDQGIIMKTSIVDKTGN